ncbi:uridine kinase [Micromonospora sp. NPDC050417]|uniref:uridine kinase n=1 Tax=Micromonospora sp. NPDC050417 TaxID=3364280 RepID=UPI0037BC628A
MGRPARLGRTRLVAVDGPSGAGKSVFAGRLAAALSAVPVPVPVELTGDGPVEPLDLGAGEDVPVVRTDDLLAGWDDQLTFWPRLDEWVLAPLRAARPGRYRRYDWAVGAFGPDWVTVPPAPVVVIEGVSSSRAGIAPELSLAIFVTAPPRLRLDRVLARDGAEVLPDLTRWRQGERRHFAADATADRADLVVDGAPGAGAIDHATTALDQDIHYIRLR